MSAIFFIQIFRQITICIVFIFYLFTCAILEFHTVTEYMARSIVVDRLNWLPL